MSSLSEFFNRKGNVAAAEKAPTLSPGKGPAGDDRPVETWAEMGSRIGSDNEVLRNLLVDTGRQVGALDDLKDAFGKLVDPINKTLRALEQEKSDNVSLRGTLADLRGTYETLRGEFNELGRRNAAGDTEIERLRHELAVVQQSARNAEISKTELGDELSTVRGRVSELERQLSLESTNARTLLDEKHSLSEHSTAADKRIVELEGETSAAKERLVLLENEKRSLQNSLEQLIAENSKLTRRTNETDNMLAGVRTRLEQVETALANSETDRNKLTAAVDEANERRQSEANTLNLRLEAMQSRARHAQITELQRIVQKQATDLQITREESHRNAERAATAARRMGQLEAETAASTQKFRLADQERAAVQSLLDKALNDSADMSRRLLDTDKALAAAQTRLAKVENAFTEAQSERIRLAAALEDTKETLRKDTIAQNARFEALQARAQLGDKLLEEARQTLAARAEEISAFDRRLAEATLSRSAIETKFSQIETALTERDTEIQELQEKRAALTEQNAELARAIGTRESAYNRAQEKIQAQDELIQMLEGQIKAVRETNELQIEELKAQLQREQLDRSMAEGALEAGRKDIARLLRELSTMQYRPAGSTAEQPAAPVQIANAA